MSGLLRRIFGAHEAQEAEPRAYGIRLYVPELGSINVASVLLAIAALVALLRFKVGMLPVLAASAALGALYFYIR